MKCRNFIKTTAAGSALLLTSSAYAFNSNTPDKKKFGYQSERQIPIAYDVDVVVIGGSTACVAAAVEASRGGTKVFLAAQERFVCGLKTVAF